MGTEKIKIAKKIWDMIVKHVWPLIWPVIRDSIVEVSQDVFAWIKKAILELLKRQGAGQQEHAKRRAEDAAKKAAKAEDQETKIRAEAEAESWKEIAKQLEADNKALKKELEKVLKEAKEYMKERTNSESVKGNAKNQIMALPAPKEVLDQNVGNSPE